MTQTRRTRPRFPVKFSPTHVRKIIRECVPAADGLGCLTFDEVDARIAETREPLVEVQIDGAPVAPPKGRLRVVQSGHAVRVPPPVVVADAREQQPYDFKRFRKWIERVEPARLGTGDYSVQGCESIFAVERKRLDDLAQSLGMERERFVRALIRLGKLKKSAIVIEGSLARTKSWQPNSAMHPNAITGSLAAACARWNIQIVFASCRDLAEEWTASLLSKWWAYHWLKTNGYKECLIEGDI